MTAQERESDYFQFDLEVSIILGVAWAVACGRSSQGQQCTLLSLLMPPPHSSVQQTGCQSAATGQTSAWQTSRTLGIWEAMTTWGPLQTFRRQLSKEKMVCILRMLSPWETRTGPVPIWKGTEIVRAKDTLSSPVQKS